jgi:ABC-type branched-subunit amino acid transport system substrate-binding protein
MKEMFKKIVNKLIKYMYGLGAAIIIFAGPQETSIAEPGITKSTIRIAGVMDLEGRSRGLGQGMRAGIKAALKNEKIQGRRIEYSTSNDSYTPSKTITETNKVVRQNNFLVMGNVGTPTAKVSLPILAKHNVPAVGFFTGAGLLRPGVGDIINYRASYVQETAAVIDSALRAGIKTTQICAFVQNDAYGMAGVEGIKRALLRQPGTKKIVRSLNRIIKMKGENPDRNGMGPVGVYQRNTFTSKEGYESLKKWEKNNGSKCKVVVSVGTYNSIARFAGYARYKGERWVISAVSFTGADNFRNVLNEFSVNDNIVMTQVVPPLNSKLPIVNDAKNILGENFGYVTLEGYIVGKMWLAIMNKIKGDITREKFVNAAKGSKFNVGGIDIDFTDDNQGSDLVLLTYLDDGEYKIMRSSIWKKMLKI